MTPFVAALVALTAASLAALHRLRRQRDAWRQRCREMEGLLGAQQAHYQAIADSQTALRRYRHDMRNHMAAISGLLALGDIPRLQAYMAQIRQEDMATGGVITGNLGVDALLWEKSRQAAARQVDLEHTVLLPPGCILPPDFLHLFLDEALAWAIDLAATGETTRRWVDVELRQRGSLLTGRLKLAAPADAPLTAGEALCEKWEKLGTCHLTRTADGPVLEATVFLPEPEQKAIETPWGQQNKNLPEGEE